MKRIFLSYRFTGEDIKELEFILRTVCDSLEQTGCDVFCSLWLEDFFKKEGFSVEKIYEFCLERLRTCNIFLAFVKSADRSTGMEMEFREAKALNKTIILVIKRGLSHPFLLESPHYVIEFDEIQELAFIHEEM